MARLLNLLAITLLLAGCAAFSQLRSDVSTYSQWPAERKAGAYVFERLPSQQARPEQQQRLEDAARRALEAAGFSAAADEKSAEYSVQLGARVTGFDHSPYDDPFWWRGGLWYSRHGRPVWGPGWGMGLGWSTPTYEREVALLIRERSGGKPLYEARASNDGGSASIDSLLPAMFEATLKDFPYGGVNPRRVVTQITR